MSNNFKVDPKDHVGIYVPAQTIFPEINGTFDELCTLLGGLPKQETLFTCAHLNLVVSNPIETSRFTQQQYVLSWFFTPAQVLSINQFAAANHGTDRTAIFFRGQLLELMRWAAILCSTELNSARTYDELETRNNLARAALICSGIWASRVYGDRFGLQQQSLTQSKRHSAGAARNAVVETWDGLNPTRAASRGQSLFFDFMPDVYPEFGQLFKGVTDLTLEQYFDCWNALISNYFPTPVQIDDTGNGVISRTLHFSIPQVTSQHSHMQDIWNKFFQLESQTLDDLIATMSDGDPNRTPESSHHYPYRALRSRPILRATDGTAILIDPTFCTEKLAHGPLFYFQNHKNLLRGSREPMASFGKAFEHYANAQLDGMFNPASSVLAKRFSSNPYGKDKKGNRVEMLDGVLNDVSSGVTFSIKHAVFFQSKAHWLMDEDHFDDDPERYATKLLHKYATEPRSGLRQLVAAISKIENGEWLPEDPLLSKPSLIYPVIVTYDGLLDAPVHANLLADEFERLLQPDTKLPNGNMQKGTKEITPLVVLTADMLEDLESSVRDFPFVELLLDYNRACPDRAISLKAYVASSGYKDHIRTNTFLAKAGLESYSRTAETIFKETNPEVKAALSRELKKRDKD